jgi:hypothetical protein
MSTELFPSDRCCVVTSLHSCSLAMGLHVTMCTYMYHLTYSDISLGTVFSFTVTIWCWHIKSTTAPLSPCVLSHTVHNFSTELPRSLRHKHFSQTALLNFTITVLCELELRRCLGHNMNEWFYVFLKGMRASKMDRYCIVSRRRCKLLASDPLPGTQTNGFLYMTVFWKFWVQEMHT